MYRFEREPLWESSPKLTGFLVSMPDPVNLSYWVRQISSSSGDLTRADIRENVNAQLAKVFTQQSERYSPTERIWRATVGDELLSNIVVKLRAGYSSRRGEWGDIAFHVNPSEKTATDGRLWQIAARAPQITESLQSKGFNSVAELDSDGAQRIITHNRDKTSAVIINLGYTSPEEAKQADSDYDPNHIDGILIRLDDLPVSVPESLKNLQHLQAVGSYFLDSLYEVFDKKPPNLVIELSESSELR